MHRTTEYMLCMVSEGHSLQALRSLVRNMHLAVAVHSVVAGLGRSSVAGLGWGAMRGLEVGDPD